MRNFRTSEKKICVLYCTSRFGIWRYLYGNCTAHAIKYWIHCSKIWKDTYRIPIYWWREVFHEHLTYSIHRFRDVLIKLDGPFQVNNLSSKLKRRKEEHQIHLTAWWFLSGSPFVSPENHSWNVRTSLVNWKRYSDWAVMLHFYIRFRMLSNLKK